MGNPPPLKLAYDFIETLIRDFLDPMPLKLDQLFSENPIREILTDPLQEYNPYPSFIQILIRDFSESLSL